MRARARCFRIGGRLQHLRKNGRCYWFHEAESGSLALGSRFRSSRQSFAVRPAAPPGRTDPFRAVGYPSTPDRSYMLNEQFTRPTPHSRRDKSGFPGAPKQRSERRATKTAANHAEYADSSERQAGGLTIHHIVWKPIPAERLAPRTSRLASRVSRERALTQPRRSHTEKHRRPRRRVPAGPRCARRTAERPAPADTRDGGRFFSCRGCNVSRARSARPPITRERSG
jgi:hypothetical protein